MINYFTQAYRRWMVGTWAHNREHARLEGEIPINRVRFSLELSRFWAKQAWHRLTWVVALALITAPAWADTGRYSLCQESPSPKPMMYCTNDWCPAQFWYDGE